MHSPVHETIAATWRLESSRIVAALARITRDLGVAEELAQDALLAALQHWPVDGVPTKPGAWLMATAKHRALDHLRHRARASACEGELAAELVALQADTVPDIADAVDAARSDDIGDDLLRLMFAACHPLLSADARVALTLKVVAGLSTPEIAQAFLVPEATIAQRIVRAKRQLAEARVPFEVPRGSERAPRLASVLEVVYLVFNEGYAASSGAAWVRTELAHEALRLARQLAAIAPEEAEVHGLLALLELQASRLPARHDAHGQPVLLEAQDRRRWDRLLLRRGLDALARAETLAQAGGGPPGPYALQAAIAGCHARAAEAAATDWDHIAALYGQLAQCQPTPVVQLNRAVALSRSTAPGAGPAAALALVEPLRAEPALQRYPWLPAVHGDLLQRLGRDAEARQAFEAAARLAGNAADRALMQARADALAPGGAPLL
jgi:RNA polymerase sigma factor (sigma-70 family)